MKTCVDIILNGASFTYYFSMSKKDFMKRWNNNTPVIGYISLEDITGKTVIINPSNCSVVEIKGE